MLGASVVLYQSLEWLLLLFLCSSGIQMFKRLFCSGHFVCQGCNLVPFSCCSYPFLASHWMGLHSDQVDYYRGQTSSPTRPSFKRKCCRRGAEGCRVSVPLVGLSHQCHLPLWVVSLLHSRDWYERGRECCALAENSLSSRPGELLLDLKKCWLLSYVYAHRSNPMTHS